jgi:hypothetical protein
LGQWSGEIECNPEKFDRRESLSSILSSILPIVEQILEFSQQLPDRIAIQSMTSSKFAMTNSADPSLQASASLSPGLPGESPAITDDFTNPKYLVRRINPDYLTDAIVADLAALVQLRHPAILFPRKSRGDGTILFPSSSIGPYSRPTTALGQMKVLLGIAEALRYLHDHGILHPIQHASIALNPAEEPLIVNPGVLRHLFGSADAAGSPVLESPESDVHAFGAFAYEVLTGHPALPDEALVFDAGFQAGAAELVRTCLDSNPGHRPTFAYIVRLFLSGDLNLPHANIFEFQSYATKTISGEFTARLLIETLLRSRVVPAIAATESRALNEPSNHEGLIGQLNREWCGNVHELGVVSIDGNHFDDEERLKIGGILTRGWRSHWESKNEPNAWIQFDFTGTGRRLRLWKYEIQTWNSDIGHVNEWVVEGSVDRRHWDELDRRVGVTQLNRPSRRCCFKCRKHEGEYQIIRITQTGPNSSGMDIFNISGVEFYGELV